MAGLITKLENAIKCTFNHNIMNYLIFMMDDHHVHCHAIPRYHGSRRFASLEWVDNGWPALPVMPDSQHKNQKGVIQSVQEALIAATKT